MANVINTNISSLNAQRNLSTSQSSLATSLQRLSTGLRINSAKDDAAGQAISTRMTAQISGMQQASRNANDGISMSQTAEGAMGSINDILLRMRDLSVQSSNGTNGTAERETIQNEVTQLYEEIDRISGSTDFNGIKLLDGSAKSNSFQIGANAGQTISFGIKEVSTKSMNLSGSAPATGDVSSGRITDSSATGLDKLSNASLSINGTAIKFDSKDLGTDDNRSASEVVKAINGSTSTTGVTASASNVVKGTAAGTGVLAAGDLTITVQNADGTAGKEIDIAASKNMDELVANINAQVGGITAALDDKGVLTLSNDTGAAITIKAKTEAVATAAGLDSATAQKDEDNAVVGATYNGYISLSGQNGTEIKLAGEDLAKFGFNASTGSGKLSGSSAIVGEQTDANKAVEQLNKLGGGAAITSTDKVKINGVELNQDAFNSAFTAAEKAQAINNLTAQTGVKATASTDAFVDLSAAADGDKYAINGRTYTLNDDDLTPDTGKGTTEEQLVKEIQDAFAAGTSGGVNAQIDAKSGKVHLFSSTGQDIVIGGDPSAVAAHAVDPDDATATVNTGTISISTAADSAGEVLNTAKPGDPDTDPTTPEASAIAVRGKISLASESGSPIKLEDGNGGTGLAKLGLVEQGGSADPILGGKLDVSTAKGAQDAIGRIDKAISFIAEQRSNMGAVQNRLSTTISNLATATENASSARSRIQDTDFATETANMTRGQILQQAGTAMLAQANSLPNGVLSLLRG